MTTKYYYMNYTDLSIYIIQIACIDIISLPLFEASLINLMSNVLFTDDINRGNSDNVGKEGLINLFLKSLCLYIHFRDTKDILVCEN